MKIAFADGKEPVAYLTIHGVLKIRLEGGDDAVCLTPDNHHTTEEWAIDGSDLDDGLIQEKFYPGQSVTLTF
jgi:hypothetical protein